jgi:hypothetical protein
MSWDYENTELGKIYESKPEKVTEGGWKLIIGSFMTLLMAIYNRDGEIKEGEMGKACKTHGKEGEWIQSFVRKIRRKETCGKTKA